MATRSVGSSVFDRGAEGISSKIGKNKSDSLANRNKTTASGNEPVKVELSKDAVKFAAEKKMALEIANATPDIREDKINYFKEKLKSGTYKIDEGKIADGILFEAMKEKVAAT